ncbi:PorP/SprF family type IX secretion system membrane protein [Phaeodactylibacter xiamenensis]|uniref:PorP/SprF family type IX secretion system membrane protein n=1 Tax=Phaeodactylibacter xiamenensis TaxID=1524460 RepID=UPI0024A7F179|nr:PorP/SprF family type IX secretion system membrane protein [Phaeodactylibacter xiamenensis]
MKNLFYVFAFLLLAQTSIMAQDPHSSFIGITPGPYNPAMTGSINDARTRITIHNRHQFGPVLGSSGAYRTYSASVESYTGIDDVCSSCSEDILAFGFHATGDRRGEIPLYRLDANLSIAYRKLLDKDMNHRKFMYLGAKAGFINHSIDFGGLTFNEQFANPNLPPELSGGANSLVPDFGIGLGWSYLSKYRMGKSFEAGASMSHINTPEFSLLEESINNRYGQVINKLFTIHAQARLPIYRDKVAINPSFVFRYQDPHTQLLLGTQMLFALEDGYMLSVGGGCRISKGADQPNGDAAIASLGLLISNQLEVSFHYDAGLTIQQSVPQSLELAIAYRFGKKGCLDAYTSYF